MQNRSTDNLSSLESKPEYKLKLHPLSIQGKVEAGVSINKKGYFNEEQQKKAQLKASEGIFYFQNEPADGVFLYVVIPDSRTPYYRIIVTKKEELTHAMLSNCESVYAAGELELNEGVLSYINNNSTDYPLTGKEMRPVLLKIFTMTPNPDLLFEDFLKSDLNNFMYFVDAFLQKDLKIRNSNPYALFSLKSEYKEERRLERAYQKAGEIGSYYTDDQQKNAELKPKDGIFYLNGKKASGTFIYTVIPDSTDPYYRIIVSNEKGCRHSMLSNGKKVLAAGSLNLEEGVLIRVSNNSGHYRITAEEMRTMVEKFLEISKNPALIFEDHSTVEDTGFINCYLASDFIHSDLKICERKDIYSQEVVTYVNDDFYRTTLCDVGTRFGSPLPSPSLERKSTHSSSSFKEEINVDDDCYRHVL